MPGPISMMLRRVQPGSYLYLLLSLIALLVVHPFLRGELLGTAVFDLFLSLTLLVTVFAVSERAWQLIVVLAVALLMIAGRWSAHLFAADWPVVAGYAAGALFFLYTAAILLRDILIRHTRVTIGLIYGALSIYLLLGLIWAFGYALLEALEPGSFSFNGQALGDRFEAGELFPQLVYFSFVTLTTLGYGDITPAGMRAGSFAYLEAIIGQVYLTVLVARLVGMHISQRA